MSHTYDDVDFDEDEVEEVVEVEEVKKVKKVKKVRDVEDIEEITIVDEVPHAIMIDDDTPTTKLQMVSKVFLKKLSVAQINKMSKVGNNKKVNISQINNVTEGVKRGRPKRQKQTYFEEDEEEELEMIDNDDESDTIELEGEPETIELAGEPVTYEITPLEVDEDELVMSDISVELSEDSDMSAEEEEQEQEDFDNFDKLLGMRQKLSSKVTNLKKQKKRVRFC